MTKIELAVKSMGASVLASAFLLASCSETTVDADSDGDGNVTAAEVGAVVSDLRPEPGKYSVNLELVKVEIPGAPQQMLDAMGSMMNRSFEYCLSPEQAEQGFEESLTEGQGDNCTIEKFSLTGNDLEMSMSCSAAGEGEMKSTMTGTVSPTKSEISVNTTGTLAEMGEANIQMNMLQERIGECDS